MQQSIQSIRQQFPQYDDLSDGQLADALHSKFYADMDRGDFYQRIGYEPRFELPEDIGIAPADRLPDGQRLELASQGRSGFMSWLPDGVADGLESFRDERLFPSPIAEAGKNIVADLVTEPGRTIDDTGKDIIRIPGRAVEGIAQVGRGIGQGNFQMAGLGAVAAATAGMEGAMTVMAPGSNQVRQRASREVAREVAEQAPRTVADSFVVTGVTPSRAALSDSRAVQGVVKSISENAIGGSGVRARTRQQLAEVEAATNRVADAFGGPVSASEAGEVVLSGVQAHRRGASRLYDRAFRSVNLDAVSDVPATRASIRDALARFDSQALNDMFSPAIIRRLDETIQSANGMTVRDIRQLRTEVRAARNRGRLETTQDDRALALLERDITDDLYRAVAETSGDGALARMRAADRYYRESMERVHGALRPFARPDQTEEGAFRQLVSAMQGQTTSRGRGDFARIRALRRALGPDEMGMVASGVLRSAGRATEGGDFSVSVFARNWRNMGERQKDIVFGQGTALRRELDDLAVVTGRLSSIEDMANFSRSGVSIQNIATIGGVANPATMVPTAFAVLGQYAVGDLLTNPRYVRILSDSARNEFRVQSLVRAGRATQAEALRYEGRARALTSIAAIESSDDDLAGVFDEVRAQLENSNAPSQ